MAYLLSEKTKQKQRNDNFLLLRMVLASLVLWVHSYAITGTPFIFSSYFHRASSLLLDAFFVSSGFLVASSLFNCRSAKDFAIFRFLRLMPALLLSVTFCVFVVGPVFTQLSLVDYFSQYSTYRFFIVNGTLIFQPPQWHLPEVFANNLMRHIVNGSLWTLPYEGRFYTGMAFIGIIVFTWRWLNEKQLGVLLLLLGIPCLLRYAWYADTDIDSVVGARFYGLFLTSAAFYIFRDKIWITPKIFFPGLFVTVICLFLIDNPLPFRLAYIAFLGYFILALVYTTTPLTPLLLKYNRLGDYSYGTYVFAFPVQQALAAIFPNIGFYGMLCSSFVIALLFACCSWHFVEYPILVRKKIISNWATWLDKKI